MPTKKPTGRPSGRPKLPPMLPSTLMGLIEDGERIGRDVVSWGHQISTSFGYEWEERSVAIHRAIMTLKMQMQAEFRKRQG